MEVRTGEEPLFGWCDLKSRTRLFFFCPDTFIRFHLHHNTFLLFKYLYLDISKSEIYNRVSSGFEKYEGRESEFLPLHPNNIKKKVTFFHLFYIHASYRIV